MCKFSSMMEVQHQKMKKKLCHFDWQVSWWSRWPHTTAPSAQHASGTIWSDLGGNHELPPKDLKQYPRRKSTCLQHKTNAIESVAEKSELNWRVHESESQWKQSIMGEISKQTKQSSNTCLPQAFAHLWILPRWKVCRSSCCCENSSTRQNCPVTG